jgi:hypothetical protein
MPVLVGVTTGRDAKRSFEAPGEAVVSYVSLRGNIEIRCIVPADAA